MLADIRGKEPSELRVGLGHDMRLSSPEMADGVRTGLVEEGVTVIDAGQVATEMSYYLVGSRELDGGAMVTASHNPKKYTGVKLLREGALALSGDAGIQEVRAQIEAGMPDPPGGGSVEEIDIYPDFHEHMLAAIDTDAIGPLRILADGSDGMAGPMVGPLLERLNLDVTTSRWEPNGDFPEAGPEPVPRGEPPHAGRAGEEAGRRPGDRLGRRRRPLLLHRRRTGPSATATSSARCSPAPRSPRSPARRSSTTRARAERFPTPSRRRAASPT